MEQVTLRSTVSWLTGRKHYVALFVLFVAINSLWLGTVPGLFGDEASEGQNVWEILNSHTLVTVIGERSYIGPLVDYARIPFVLIFGYSALALRALMFVAALATFFLAQRVFQTLFGKIPGTYAAVALLFSPTYLLYERLGWAVTLFPFWAVLLLFLILHGGTYRAVLAGLAAGLGLHNYVTFFPTIVAIAIPAALVDIRRHGFWAFLQRWWLALVGFWAAFGTQFAVMQMYQEDQGRPWEVVGNVSERLQALPAALEHLVSGSMYIAHYRGMLLSPGATHVIALTLGALVLVALLQAPRLPAWLWFGGSLIQLTGIVLMVDRFTLRYFVVFVLAIWALAGYGFAKAVLPLLHRPRWQHWTPLVLATALTLFSFFAALLPFHLHGGGLDRFSLDDPNSTAEMMVTVRPLVACLRGRGVVYSDDIHIYNRLLYLGHQFSDLLPTDDKTQASVLVRHRSPAHPNPEARELCPELRHFWVVPYSSS